MYKFFVKQARTQLASFRMKVLFLNPSTEMAAYQVLSAYLKQHGHQTKVVNDPLILNNMYVSVNFEGVFNLVREDILEEILNYDPDIIGLSVVSNDSAWAFEWSKRIKERLNVPIIWGNIFPTTEPKRCLESPHVDFIARGEGELTLTDLLDALEHNRPLSSVKGLGFKDSSGNVVINEMRPLIEDMDSLPFPDKDFYYKEMPYFNIGYTAMSGRGCPYHCTFCDNNTSMKLYKNAGIKQKWTRRHSPERMVAELVWAKEKYNIKHVLFNDEDFSYSKKWIQEFAPLYQKEVGLPFFAWVYPNTMDEETTKLLADAGCVSVEMGIQTGSERLRNDIIKRKTPHEKIISSLKNMRKYKIRAAVDIIVGLPSETKEDLDKTVSLLVEGRPFRVYAYWLRYYSSTEILSIARERNLLSAQELADLARDSEKGNIVLGGSELGLNKLTFSYHTFIMLTQYLPRWMGRFFLKYDLIQYFPRIHPVYINVLQKLVKPLKFDQLNRRRVFGVLFELRRIFKIILKRKVFKNYNGPKKAQHHRQQSA